MKAVLIVVDLQERLIKHIPDREAIIRNSVKLVKACKLLGIPIILTKQIKLGDIVEEIREIAEGKPIVKSSFSCVKCDDFLRRLEEAKPERCILVGIEAHICILQTAIDLMNLGYKVYAALDCIGSRRAYDKEVAILRMLQENVIPATSESIIYELVETAEHEKFKEVLEIVKS